MNALVFIAAVAAYAAAGLAAARILYGRWRAQSIDVNARNYPNLYSPANAVATWNRIDRTGVMAGALAAAFFWPVKLPVAALIPVIIRFMNATSVLSRVEMQARIAERDRRIAELEREARGQS